MNTRSIKKSELEAKWYLLDASGVRLGKLATKVAALLIGKDDVNTTDYHEPQNHVVVVNIKSVDVHPKKLIGKKYNWHSGFPGGLKEVEYQTMMERKPEYIISHAVSGMLPKNKKRDLMLSNLHIYQGAEHKHAAQQPVEIKEI
jgi:large subunit ribosomal protein L13